MLISYCCSMTSSSRSREGAWIEIIGLPASPVDQGRSREGAWIEIVPLLLDYMERMVAPVRERGLK